LDLRAGYCLELVLGHCHYINKISAVLGNIKLLVLFAFWSSRPCLRSTLQSRIYLRYSCAATSKLSKPCTYPRCRSSIYAWLALPAAEQTLLCKHRINAVSEEHSLYPEIQLGVTGLE